MSTKARRPRRGSSSIVPRGRRFLARVDLGVPVDGERIRYSKTFDTRERAQAWIDEQRGQPA